MPARSGQPPANQQPPASSADAAGRRSPGIAGIANVTIGVLMVLVVLAGIWVAVETQRGARAPGSTDSPPRPAAENPLP
ncbi:hypothetical protein ABZ639_06600 [Saccharomonospora sp. NPDC006951]